MKMKTKPRRHSHKVKFGPLLSAESDSSSDDSCDRANETTLVELDIDDPEPLELQHPVAVERPLTAADFSWKTWLLSCISLFTLLVFLLAFLIVPIVNTSRSMTSPDDVNVNASEGINDNFTTAFPSHQLNASISVLTESWVGAQNVSSENTTRNGSMQHFSESQANNVSLASTTQSISQRSSTASPRAGLISNGEESVKMNASSTREALVNFSTAGSGSNARSTSRADGAQINVTTFSADDTANAQSNDNNSSSVTAPST